MKLPRDLSGEEVCRALVRLGFECRRQTGSHYPYVKGALHPCVPMHRQIRRKTLQSILKQAGILLTEWLDNLNRVQFLWQRRGELRGIGLRASLNLDCHSQQTDIIGDARPACVRSLPLRLWGMTL